jgi:hypothetical protein
MSYPILILILTVFLQNVNIFVGDVKMRDPVSPTMKAMSERLSEANADKTKDTKPVAENKKKKDYGSIKEEKGRTRKNSV